MSVSVTLASRTSSNVAKAKSLCGSTRNVTWEIIIFFIE